jgi:iron complex outermembrane recepter protein
MTKALFPPCVLVCTAATITALSPADLRAQAAAGDAQQVTTAQNVNTQSNSDALSEIVVTARKRSEDNQLAPIAITAFGSQDLQRLGMTSVENLGAQTPSLNFQQSPYDAFGSFIGMRGQQATEIVITQTPPVGIYVDDVYYPNTLATSLENFEGVDQVEVLKGPQGTLYGRNTTGGAIKITTRLPDYSETSGDIKVGYGNYDAETASGSLNLPIINDRVALNLAGNFAKNDGFGEDLGNGVPLENNESEALRGTLRLDLTSELQVLVRGEWAHATSTQNIENLSYVAPGFSIASAAVGAQIGALTPADFSILGGLLTTGAPPAGTTPQQLAAFFNDVNTGRNALVSYICKECRNDTFATPAQLAAFGVSGVPIVPHSKVDLATGSIVSTYEFSPDLYAKSITAVQSTARSTVSSESASPFLLINGIGDDQNPHQITQELQVGGNAIADKLKWVAGYYFFNLKGHDDALNAEIVPFEPNPITAQSEFTDTSNSAYGQGTYTLIPGINFTAGLRYTSERTKLTLGNRNAVACDVQGVPPTATGDECSADFHNRFHNLSHTVGLDWQALEDILLYAKTSTGFRAGGTNQRSNPALPYAPETVTDYEIGAKSEWLDHRLRINLATYHSDYKDIQRSVSVIESGSLITEVQNAASATINGVELEITARPVRSLTITASGAYTDPRYQTYYGLSATGTPVNLSGNRFPDVSLWQASLSGTYSVEDRLGSLDTTVDSSFRSSVDFAPDNHDANSAFSTTQGSYGLLNARVSQEIRAWNTTVSVWGKNITDKHYIVGGNDFSTQLGFAYTIPGHPATYGLEVSMRF